jgi:sarcosine oxidase, subunit beta
MAETVEIIIIGGGILGCAVAYYCSRFGVKNVLVLERRSLAEANTSRAAGLLTQARDKAGLMPMISETYQAIDDLEACFEDPIGLHRVGSLYMTASLQKKLDLTGLARSAQAFGIRVVWIRQDEAVQMVPWLDVEEATALAFMPDDAYIDPYRLARGYARAARQKGVIFREGVNVTDIIKTGNRISGVKNSQGEIAASMVIDAAGVWAGLLACQIGLGLPMAPVRSQYWITAPHPLFNQNQPLVILPDARAYTRPEVGSLLFGLREVQSVHVDPRLLPHNMERFAIHEDPNGWDSLLEDGPELSRFFSLLDEIEIAHYIFGPSTY